MVICFASSPGFVSTVRCRHSHTSIRDLPRCLTKPAGHEASASAMVAVVDGFRRRAALAFAFGILGEGNSDSAGSKAMQKTDLLESGPTVCRKTESGLAGALTSPT